MIDFSLPENVRQQLQMAQMMASQVMRPKARQLDENEHERAKEFTQFMWPIAADMQRATLERARRKAEGLVEERKGPGIGNIRMIFMTEILAWGDVAQWLSTPGAMLGGSAIEAVGTMEQKERFLSRFADHRNPPAWGGMAMTEPGAGSDTAAIATTAVLDPETNEWVLNGEKIFCTNGGLALNESNGLIVVWATLDRGAGRAGMRPFVVEAGTPGVTVTKEELKHGIRASNTVSIVLSDARIPYDNMLGSAEIQKPDEAGSKGFKGAMKTFDASRPLIAASAIGVARAALEITCEKLAEAGIVPRYDAPPHERTAIEQAIIEMEADLKAAWLLTLRAGSMMDHGQPNALESSMAKAKAGEVGTRIGQTCVELLGPLGYSREWLVEKLMRDSKIADIYEGTHEINLLIVARQILGYTGRELR